MREHRDRESRTLREYVHRPLLTDAPLVVSAKVDPHTNCFLGPDSGGGMYSVIGNYRAEQGFGGSRTGAASTGNLHDFASGGAAGGVGGGANSAVLSDFLRGETKGSKQKFGGKMGTKLDGRDGQNGRQRTASTCDFLL